MARTYRKANKLKVEILNTAGHFFKNYGYEDTTFQLISDELSISKATISYHYKSKSLLLFSLFMKDMEVIDNFVRESMPECSNIFKAHCAAHIYFYRRLLANESNCRLFYHVDNRSLWSNEYIHIIEGCFRNIMADFKKEFTDSEIRALSLMSIGAKLSMFKEFVNKPGSVSIDSYCHYTASLVGMLSRLDEATVEKNINAAFEFADKHELPGMSFLN